MAVLGDRVRETTTTTGTGTIDLDGALDASFESFVAAGLGGSTVFYWIVHQDQTLGEWEHGTGTVTDATPDTLSRDTVHASSNADALVSFSAGTKDVFIGSSVQVFSDASLLSVNTIADAQISQSSVTQHEAAIDHDALLNFVASEHIDHSTVLISSGNGLTGGGDITASRTLAIATDGVQTDELDLNIAPAWAGTHDFSGGGLILPTAPAPTPTTEGQITWDTDDDKVRLGDGVGTITLVDEARTITAGTGLSGGGDLSADRTLSADEANIDHDALQNFVANEHIDHSTVTLTAGDALTGGGDITASRTFDLDIAGTTDLAAPATGDELVLADTSNAGAIRKADIASVVNLADHDQLTNFVANEHVDHSAVSITAGNALTGGGDLTASRTLAVATDGIQTDELDLSIAPTWTGLHTFNAGIALSDNDVITLGTGGDATVQYDGTNLLINPAIVVGTGRLDVTAGDVSMAGSLRLGGVGAPANMIHLEGINPAIRHVKTDNSGYNWHISEDSGGNNAGLIQAAGFDGAGAGFLRFILWDSVRFETPVQIQVPNSTAGTALVKATNDGTLEEIQRDSSSLRYKTEVTRLGVEDIDPAQVLAIDPIRYRRNGRWETGFGAEHFDWGPLSDGLAYNGDDTVEGFLAGSRVISVAHHIVLRDHESRIERLESRLNQETL